MTLNPKDWEGFLERTAAELDIRLTAPQLRQCRTHAESLLRWNRKTNLTTITDPRDMAIKHFVDAMASMRMMADGENLIDIGSGGGFPGLPLKILNPTLRVTLIDASRKKVSFLKEVIRSLHLTGIQALHVRAEALSEDIDHHESYGVAVSRAFSSLDSFVGMALPLIKTGGKIIAMKGKNLAEEIESLRSMRLTLKDGGEIHGEMFSIDFHSYELPVSGDKRTLIAIRMP